jgi:hypothetical protein
MIVSDLRAMLQLCSSFHLSFPPLCIHETR